MFFKLAARNSARSRKENGLFFASLLISVAAFYIILSLSHQDVMVFLRRMESDAVNRLMGMIPMFYVVTLFILFFLVYYAGSFQMERRRHEFGMYLMMGMRRHKLFAMLLAEDLRSSIIALAVGLPAAVLLSELISLVTARLVGMGIIGHRTGCSLFSFSLTAAAWTAAGFLLIKFLAFLILSGRIAGQGIDALLAEPSEGMKRQLPAPVYASALIIGMVCLGIAYSLAISGLSWYKAGQMGLTLFLGISGTLLIFFGLRIVFGFLVKYGEKNGRLHVFNLRQLQENVILRSNTLAISSLLMLTALCCFGAGVAIAAYYGESEQHVLDYTFVEYGQDAADIRKTLSSYGLDTQFAELFDMEIGHINIAGEGEDIFRMEAVMSALSELPESRDRDILLNNLSYAGRPYLISLSGYNKLLSIADSPLLELKKGEAAIYIDSDLITSNQKEMLSRILETEPECHIGEEPLRLKGSVQTAGLVTDRSITLLFALILPDEVFDYYTDGIYSVYLDGVLNTENEKNVSLMAAISEMNEKLNGTGLKYESYLQNMGRQLFYMVASSYITIYLAIIFLIIANTVIGVQFLTGQQKSGRRYKTLIRLGADYEILCKSAGKQIRWYFGIPTAVAVISSFFGVRALFSGLLISRVQGSVTEMMWVSAATIIVLFMIECIYIVAVKRISNRYLLTLMEAKREE